MIASNSRLTRPDIDLADLMYYKEIEYEKEVDKLMVDMQKMGRVAENLDLARRQQNREQDRLEAIQRIQEEEEEARRMHDEARLA